MEIIDVEEEMRIIDIRQRMELLLGDLYGPAMGLFKIVLIVILSALTVKIGSFAINKLLEKRKGTKRGEDMKKLETMSTLLKSVLRYGVYIVAAVIIFTDVFKMTSVLAAAGIGGVAVGFGAQSLIKDIISGIFIVFEDQYAVGDLITIDDLTGTVEEMELRVTKLRNYNGDLYIIPNGEIKKVINQTRGNKVGTVNIPLAYSTDTERAVEIADAVCLQVSGEFDTIVEQPKVLGITEMGRDGMNLMIIMKTLPNSQWEVERRIRKLVKDRYSEAGIEFFDRYRLVLGNDGSKGGDNDG
jgi:small conductance mechanosensitive channel